jgi:hypothetical protein
MPLSSRKDTQNVNKLFKQIFPPIPPHPVNIINHIKTD